MLAAADLARAAAVLNEGEKVAVLIGQGARNAWLEVEALADVLGAGVAKALLGKDALPDDLPYVTGSIGLLGTRPSYEMMRDCDTLLVVGSSFPYTQFLPEFGRARAVQIDIDPFMVDLRYPFEVNLVGDAGEALRALLPDDVMLAADSGSAANWYARHLRMRKAMRGSLSGTLATMGPGVPYAIGAKFAHPDRLAVAIVGDGVMQMNGMAELITAAKYFWDWQGPRLVVAVLNNQDLNQVTWEMRAMSGAPTSYPRRHCPTCPTRTSQGPSGWAAYGWRSRTAWSPPEAGPGRRPSLRHRLPYRPRRAADSAARRPRPDRSHRRRDPQGRQRPCWDGPAGSQGQDPGDPAGSRPLPSRRRRSMMGAGRRRVEEPSVDGVDAAAYTVPTDAPEGTAPWRGSTSLVLARVGAAGLTGLGYVYGAPSTAEVIRHELAPVVTGLCAWDVPAENAAMSRPGVSPSSAPPRPSPPPPCRCPSSRPLASTYVPWMVFPPVSAGERASPWVSVVDVANLPEDGSCPCCNGAQTSCDAQYRTGFMSTATTTSIDPLYCRLDHHWPRGWQ